MRILLRNFLRRGFPRKIVLSDFQKVDFYLSTCHFYNLSKLKSIKFLISELPVLMYAQSFICSHIMRHLLQTLMPFFQFSCHWLTAFDHYFDGNVHVTIQFFDAFCLMTLIITSEMSFRVLESEK